MEDSRLLPEIGLADGPPLAALARWHGGWVGAVALASGSLWLAAPWTHGTGPALALGAAPALGFLIARNYDGPALRSVLVVAWALAGAAAATLTGGVSGPLAVWCLAPMAAAGLLGGRRRLVRGAVLALLAVGATALAQAMGLAGAPPVGTLAFGLGFTGLATLGLGAATAASLNVRARRALRDREGSRAPDPAQLALDRLPFPVLVTDLDGSVERAFGPPPGLNGALRDLAQLAAEPDLPGLRHALDEAVRTGRAHIDLRRPGSQEGWFAADVASLPHDRLVVCLREITAQRAREQALERRAADAEATAAGKSRFLANMSHELRTPLNAIMGFSDIMRQRIFGELPGKYVEYADLIHDAGAHLLDLINDVLDMSKIEASKYDLRLEELDAREPVQAALRLMRVQADDVGVQLRGLLPTHPIEAQADRRALKQITLNLISNALKFTPRGGLVTVSLHALAGALELSVADTGVGIAEADLARLGRPYEQAGDAAQQTRGTGLGLSLVRAFAELHDGEMLIESRLGEGTAVSVRMPVLIEAGAPDADASASDAPAATADSAQVIAFKPQR